MSNRNNRSVYRRGDEWVNKLNSTDRASSVHSTQAAADKAAREMCRNQGGGEVTTFGRDGKIVSKDTIAPGNDPRSIRDTEH